MISSEYRIMDRTHELKCVQPYFNDVWTGLKKWELRKDDRGFKFGHTVVLRDYDPKEGYKKRSIEFKISYIIRDFPGIEPGYCIIGFRSIKRYMNKKETNG